MSKARFPFPSFPVLRGFPAAWRLEVFPVSLALAALHPAEEPLDEDFGFCSDCGHRQSVSGTVSGRAPPPSSLTLVFPPTPPLRKKVRQVAGEGLEQLLHPNKEVEENRSAIPSKRAGQLTRPAEIPHLGGKLPLSVKGVQVSDHNISHFFQRHRTGRLVQGPLLHVGVEGNSSGSAVSGAAAFCGRG